MNQGSSTTCSGCEASMTAMALEGQLGRTLAIDLCATCQAFWFGPYEDLQLSPGATLQLFQIIGEHAANRRGSLASILRCPRCTSRLVLTHDMQRATPFQYWRCDQGHGRFMTYFDFLRE